MKILYNQKGIVHVLPLLLIVATVGVITFLLITSIAPFKGGFLGTLNPRSESQAATSVGIWVNVTPANMKLTKADFTNCDSFGVTNIVADPLRPSNLYANSNCQGIWKSTDFGQTWTGPINTGTNGTVFTDGVGGLSIAAGPAGQPPVIYYGAIRGTLGLWKSSDGGVNWLQLNVNVPGARGDLAPPVIDPYDTNHFILAPHELNAIYQSFDGGQNWSNVPLDPAMAASGSGGVFFINTGNGATTRNTWLWMAQATGGNVGTWRTTNGGVSWTRVETNEGSHGPKGVWQPDTSGVVYMVGIYGTQGWGAYRSTNYGATWTHIGGGGAASIIFGTPSHVYDAWSWACQGCIFDPGFFLSAPMPGITNWQTMNVPTNMTIGPAAETTVFDGNNYIFVAASWYTGLWRYVEPSSGATATPTPTPTPTAKVGDINGDGNVDIFDYNIEVQNFGLPCLVTTGDLDGNGICNIFDYNILLTNFGK